MRILLYFVFLFSFLVSCTSTSKIVETQVVNNKQKTLAYWQQHVDYTMDIDMNMENYQYIGNQKLVYTNNSPNSLVKVFYHLYPNAFQPGSEMDERLLTIRDPDKRMVINHGTREKPDYESRISKLSPEEIGFIRVNSLLQNGSKLNYSVEGTVLEVSLNKPILPDEKVVFDMNFTGQVPVQIRRSGRNNKGGVALSMTQWYPKLAEYDKEGWHTDPYIAREFYGVWGDFDVSIHIDKKYMLGGTGYLQNPQEVGFGYENKNETLQLPDTDKYTWHFIAPNVHDFTWVADKNFVHDTKTLNNGTVLHFLYKNEEKVAKNWKKMQPIAVKTMNFYNNLVGNYPYKQYSIIQGGDGGMEYGMCTLITGDRDMNSLLGTMMHEVAHSWFQFHLATHEGKHPWMDEGFASYIESLASSEILGNKPNFIFENPYKYYFYMVNTGEEEPLSTHADHYKTNMSYGINSYDKGQVFLAQLEYVIGKENTLNTLREYFKIWGGKHPGPQDFIRVAEHVSGIELDWYLNEFAQTTHTIDYGIKQVANNNITLERIGEMPMPVDVFVEFTDGTSTNYYIPLNLMRGKKPTKSIVLKDWNWSKPTYTINISKEVKQVIIDTSFYLADIDRKNNLFTNE